MADEHGLAPGEHAAGEAPHTSIWPFAIATASGITFAGVITYWPLLVVGLGAFVASLGGWLLQDARGARFGDVVSRTEPGVFRHVSQRKLGMWIFLVSEIMFFSAIIGNALALRTRASFWPDPATDTPLNIPLTAVNTFILIASSFTMVQALKGIEHGSMARLRIYLLATLVLGATFVSIQLFEYNALLFGEHLTPWVNDIRPELGTFGTAFYMQTGFHGAHVTGGVLGLLYLNYKSWKKNWFSQSNHEAVELVGLYWHFVDIVWIFLFPIVYLI